MNCIHKIEAAQAGLENTDAWMVGQQLKDICRDAACARLVAEDLDNPDMGLKACAAKIRAWADERRKETKASCVCVPPDVAEKIIRKFYGLPEAQEGNSQTPEKGSSLEDLFDEVW